VNFGERGKSSGRHSPTSTVKQVLTVSLAKGPLRMCVDLVKGFIGVRWRGFRVMTQVDLGLTGLTRPIRSLVLMTVIKNLGRHNDHNWRRKCKELEKDTEVMMLLRLWWLKMMISKTGS
jgi:hypothetical protein